MAERVKANRPGVDATTVAATYAASVPVGAPAGTGARFTALTTGGVTNCATTNCTTSDAVAYDAALWDGLLGGGASETDRTSGAGLGPLLQPRGCIEQIDATAGGCPAPGGPPSSRQVTYRISVAWQGNSETGAPPGPALACGAGLYNDPRTGAPNDNFRRIVSVEVYTVIPCP